MGLLIILSFLATGTLAGSGVFLIVKLLSSGINDAIDSIDTNKGIRGFSYGPYTNEQNDMIGSYSYMPDSNAKISSTSKTDNEKTSSTTHAKNHIDVSENSSNMNNQTSTMRSGVRRVEEFTEGKLKKIAQQDSLTGNYQILYNQPKKNTEIYNKFYKYFRTKVIKDMAERDASAVHKSDVKKIAVQIIPEGKKLSVPAEISIYQDYFVKKMSTLQEQHDQMLKDKELMIQELYGEDLSIPMDQEKFYRHF